MRRTVDDALLALREQVQAWAHGAPADVRVFVYPPEWEAKMLQRLPGWLDDRAAEGLVIDVVDVGQEFREVVRRRKAEQRLIDLELRAPALAMDSARGLAEEAIIGAIRRPLESPATSRLLVNTGSLATIASYSAITNRFYGSADAVPPVAIAFPGEGDDRALSMLNLRPDTNYHVPRI